MVPAKRSSASSPYSRKVQMRFAREMHGRWVGPFPIRNFLDLVLPPTGPCPSRSKSNFHDNTRVEQEKDMYPALISALQSLNLKNLKLINTNERTDTPASSDKTWKPGISVYSSDYPLEDEQDSTTYSGTPEKPSAPHMSVLLHFELRQGRHDPFCDTPSGPDAAQFESTEAAHIKTQGQIAAVLSDLLADSFRTHVFGVFMDSHIARLFRADRAGVLVTEAFDYCVHSEYLVDFLHRFDDASPMQWGFDMTVDHNLNEIRVPSNADPSGYIAFTQEGDLPHTESLVSRGRRVFRVRDSHSGQIHIMKDGWRESSPGVIAEWDIIAELNDAGVPHIPKILCGGNVQGEHHCTLTDQYSRSEWRVGPATELIPRVHYRFIEEVAGKSLAELGSPKELAQVLADVIEGV